MSEDPNLYESQSESPWLQNQDTLEEVYQHPHDCSCPKCDGEPPDDPNWDPREAMETSEFEDALHEFDAWLSQYDDEPSPYQGDYSEE